MKTFIQIGAGAGDQDPRSNFRDGFSEYVKSLDRSTVDRILLVEPNPINIPMLRQCWKDYPQAEIYNIGICLNSALERSITFYYAEEDAPHFQVFSINRDHVVKHYPHQEIKTSISQCLTLGEFLNTHVKQANIELLALDIEGIDAEILLENDWKNINCQHLSFEHLHLGNHAQLVQHNLESHGYRFMGPGMDHNGYDWLYKKV
jgi:hypothetical protein